MMMKLGMLLLGLLQAGVVNVADVKSDMLKEWVGDNRTDHVIEFSAGQLLPARARLSGGLLELEEGCMMALRVKQTFFVRYAGNEEIELSLDGADWRSLSDFITGNASVSLNSEEGLGSLLTFGLAAHARL